MLAGFSVKTTLVVEIERLEYWWYPKIFTLNVAIKYLGNRYQRFCVNFDVHQQSSQLSQKRPCRWFC